jgi:hypothetical protein
MQVFPMIEKGKNLQFYSWSKNNQSITVVGTRLPEKPMTFTFFSGKEELEASSEMITEFVTELKDSMSKQKDKKTASMAPKIPRRPRRTPRKRR